MPFISECLEIAPACEERMLGREGLPLLGEAGVFLTGLSTIREHYLIRRNRPEFHILMVSHDEAGALLTDGGEQPIPAGALVFLPAAVPGGLRLVGEAWHTSWILLDDVPRWQHLHRLGHRIWQGEEGEQLYHLLSLMQGEGIRSPLQPQLLSLLLALLERTLQGEVRGTPELRLQALFRRVEARLDEPWSVALLADQMACSVPHLHRLCQQVFGMGPMAWLTGLRMNKARQLLLYTNWPLAELAARVGYSDGANFANRFRRLTGQTPGAFRRLGRKPFAREVQTL
ncbi:MULTISPECIES: helix-turn-helix transcriptional regulator [Aeromonas]|uniref:helix-turn-helix transcriptional regulator n=1 Tax=Aeromonas TaxID=642 RepID=UPI0005A929A7|nr:AraC family transcriptional regulator [Aeromonas caviae]MBS4637024.1 helix-turn-helix transcriptional regulator [Aeromonas caviae]WQD90280.1 AraC family transcriptional regulator [Aeromonas caviae]SQH58786.1 AraC family transcriptional regulator [Aeromonas caviae]